MTAKDYFDQKLFDSFQNIIKQEQEVPGTWAAGWSKAARREAPYNYTYNKDKAPEDRTYYSAYNAFSLSLTAMLYGYDDPRWLTTSSVYKDPNLKFKKGYKTGYVYSNFYREFNPETKKYDKTLSGAQYHALRVKAASGDEQAKERLKKIKPNPKYIKMINASCVDGIEPYKAIDKERETFDTKPNEVIDLIASGMDVQLRRAGDQPYYDPTVDVVEIPLPEHFKSEEEQLVTGLHELGHASDDERRLNYYQPAFRTDPKGYAISEVCQETKAIIMAGYFGKDVTGTTSLAMSERYVSHFSQMADLKPKEVLELGNRIEAGADYLVKSYEKGLEKKNSLNKDNPENLRPDDLFETEKKGRKQ